LPVPTLPVTTNWSAGQLVKAPDLRAQVSDAVALLAQRPMFIGQQTVDAQSIPNSTTTTVSLDTELWDNFSGHQIVTTPSRYYAMFSGWYLCEGSVAITYTGGAGTLSAEIGGVQNGSGPTYYGGMRTGNNSGHQTVATAAKLMHMVQVGTYGSGDYLQLACFQSSGSSATIANSTGATVKAPFFSARWVAASGGTQPLAVPANAAAPVPPTALGNSWMNVNVRDTIRFLVYPPICEVFYAASATTLASATTVPATGTALSLGGTTVDNYSAYSGSTWTAPVSGIYYAYGQVGITTNSTGVSLGAGLTVNSSNYNSGSTFTIWGGTMGVVASAVQVNNVRRRLRLNAGDTVKLAGFQRDSGGTAALLNFANDWVSRLIVVWEAA
jgi:hypothetical protein